MNARPCFARQTIGVLMAILLTSTTLLSAASLTWEGDLAPTDDVKWLGGIVDTDTNWTDGTTPTTDQKHPGVGDDLSFDSGGTYGGDLDLGGGTFSVNSITVGNSSDTSDGGLSDFGVTERVISSNGTIQLGAGGITVTMVAGTAANTGRNVRFNSGIELTADTFIRRETNYGGGPESRVLRIGGVISGNQNLVIDGQGAGSGNRATDLIQTNTFTGDLTLRGAVMLRQGDAFGGPSSLGDPSNDVLLDTNIYLQATASGDLVTENDFELGTSSNVLFARFGGNDWTINGDFTGGASNRVLDILISGTREMIFAGAVQDFSNLVNIRTGAKVTIANANGSGVAWENAGRIRLNSSDLNDNQSTDLLLRGDFTLNQLIEVGNDGDDNNVTNLGQVNNGGPSDATFTGRIDVQETSFAGLYLTADAGGSATFDGEINVNGGGFGFNKIGAGTVIINGRVSEDEGNSTDIGAVTVQTGTMLINSTSASGGFNASSVTVNAGAILGGTGQVNASVVANGGIAPGASAGTLTIEDDLTLVDGSFLNFEIGTVSDLLVVNGLLTGAVSVGGVTVDVTNLGGIDGEPIVFVDWSGGSEFGVELSDFQLLDPNVGDLFISGSQLLFAPKVPEPSTALLLGLGILGLVRHTRRRRKD